MRTKGRLTAGQKRPEPSDGRVLWDALFAESDGDLVAYVNDADDAAHLEACWQAVEAIGGQPEAVAELVGALRDAHAVLAGGSFHNSPACDAARALLARLGGGKS